MSLRIVRKSASAIAPSFDMISAPGQADAPGHAQAAAGDGDGWAARLAKLIPAEALGLYGSAVALVPKDTTQIGPEARAIALWVIVLVSLAFSAAIRLKATQGEAVGPQLAAVGLSLASFLIWLVAVGAPASPIVLPDGVAFVGPLVALIWATAVSYFYKGDVSAE